MQKAGRFRPSRLPLDPVPKGSENQHATEANQRLTKSRFVMTAQTGKPKHDEHKQEL